MLRGIISLALFISGAWKGDQHRMDTMVTAEPLVLAQPEEGFQIKAHPKHKVVLKFQYKGRWYLFRRGKDYKYEIIIANRFSRWLIRWLSPIYGISCTKNSEGERCHVAQLHGGKKISKASQRYLKKRSPQELRADVSLIQNTIKSIQTYRKITHLQLAEDFPVS